MTYLIHQLAGGGAAGVPIAGTLHRHPRSTVRLNSYLYIFGQTVRLEFSSQQLALLQFLRDVCCTKYLKTYFSTETMSQICDCAEVSMYPFLYSYCKVYKIQNYKFTPIKNF